MEDLVDFVSEQAKLPVPKAKAAIEATLAYIQPSCSTLLKSTIDVLLQYPGMTEVERDLLIATRVLFPDDPAETDAPPTLDD